MKRIVLLTIFLSVIAVLGALPASAQGMIIAPPGTNTDPDWLSIDYHRVNVDIENQIARTNVEFQFTNHGEALAEGTFLFPLPEGAAVDELIMYIDGEPIEAKILAAEEARDIYIETVRRLVDPALLEYVGSNLIQARVFPIPAGESRKLEIAYSQVLEVDNGLFHYVYPLNNSGSGVRVMEQLSISVNVESNDEISNIYSPSHNIAISRGADDKSFRAGFEASDYVPSDDFSLYYGIENDEISINLLTYRESADQDGFFMLLVQPPVEVPEEQIVPKDVIIVLDQSGSMDGNKWEQAREAAGYVLDNLNPDDRFNVIAFSTGWRVYASQLLGADEANNAKDWINGLFAEGGTDINGALTSAQNMVGERPTAVLFLTDGLATEGDTIETDEILANLEAEKKPNMRIFTFGVGDDVDTILLDSLVRDYSGTGTYVRPTERIEEEVASLYNKINAPVLTDVELEIDDVVIEMQYPKQLTDLFAGEQITLVGRYRGSSDDLQITLRGEVNGESQTFVYDALDFPETAGGEAFIAKLWATRRIGDLLNNIRLNGESEELVDSVVSLSIRYGIITPYTSFLIEEDDILSQQGRARAEDSFEEEAAELADDFTGESAVDAAVTSGSLANANVPLQSTLPAPPPAAEPQSSSGGFTDADEQGETELERRQNIVNPIQTVNDKTFILQGEVWTDTTFEPDTMETTQVEFLSDAYFELLLELPELADYFAVGDHVIVVVDGVAYEVVPV